MDLQIPIRVRARARARARGHLLDLADSRAVLGTRLGLVPGLKFMNL